ncbi:hypothetical protein [Micromonospora sp. NPDC005707]|uniref:hypothetical protein n=1 Tax=Micromonospora sp. NPDC005707 TaxID=3157050 RepID=UPI0033F71E93
MVAAADGGLPHFWLALLVANIGTWMQTVGAQVRHDVGEERSGMTVETTAVAA